MILIIVPNTIVIDNNRTFLCYKMFLNDINPSGYK